MPLLTSNTYTGVAGRIADKYWFDRAQTGLTIKNNDTVNKITVYVADDEKTLAPQETFVFDEEFEYFHVKTKRGTASFTATASGSLTTQKADFANKELSINDPFYSSQQAAIDYLYNNGGGVAYLPKGIYTNSLSFYSNIAIRMDVGAVFKPSTGRTINLGGAWIDSGLFKIFDYSGGGTINFDVKNKNIYPEWFGAISDGIANDTESIQRAANVSQGKKLLVKKHLIDSFTPKNGLSICGDNSSSSYFKINSTFALDGFENIEIEKLNFYINNPEMKEGVRLYKSHNTKFNKVNIFPVAGITFEGTFLSVIRTYYSSFFKCDIKQNLVKDAATNLFIQKGKGLEAALANSCSFLGCNFTGFETGARIVGTQFITFDAACNFEHCLHVSIDAKKVGTGEYPFEPLVENQACKNVNIKNCYFETAWRTPGVLCTDWNYASPYTDGDTYVHLYPGVINCTVRDNYMVDVNYATGVSSHLTFQAVTDENPGMNDSGNPGFTNKLPCYPNVAKIINFNSNLEYYDSTTPAYPLGWFPSDRDHTGAGYMGPMSGRYEYTIPSGEYLVYYFMPSQTTPDSMYFLDIRHTDPMEISLYNQSKATELFNFTNPFANKAITIDGVNGSADQRTYSLKAGEIYCLKFKNIHTATQPMNLYGVRVINARNFPSYIDIDSTQISPIKLNTNIRQYPLEKLVFPLRENTIFDLFGNKFSQGYLQKNYNVIKQISVADTGPVVANLTNTWWNDVAHLVGNVGVAVGAYSITVQQDLKPLMNSGASKFRLYVLGQITMNKAKARITANFFDSASAYISGTILNIYRGQNPSILYIDFDIPSNADFCRIYFTGEILEAGGSFDLIFRNPRILFNIDKEVSDTDYRYGMMKNGDILYYSTVTAGGSIGRVCITPGTYSGAGTWKTFGAITS